MTKAVRTTQRRISPQEATIHSGYLTAQAKITQLEEALKTSRELVDAQRESEAAERSKRQNAEANLRTIQFDNADLKIRLASAERANEFMRGYLARVREDDAVADPVVLTGDPNGEQVYVTKRKFFGEFPRHDDFTYERSRDSGVEQGFIYNSGSRPKPKHWVNY